MSRTFSFLRSNDLIYGPAIRSYMMGEAPPAFDLLYWNGDGTNLPACMAMEYLRGLCQENQFARDGIEIYSNVSPEEMNEFEAKVAERLRKDGVDSWWIMPDGSLKPAMERDKWNSRPSQDARHVRILGFTQGMTYMR